MNTRSIITRISLVPEGKPIYDELVTHIGIEDEASGPFMVIRQDRMVPTDGQNIWSVTDVHEIRLDLDEIPEFIEAIRDIQASIEELEGTNEDF